MPRAEYEIIIRTKHELVSLPGIPLIELSRRCRCQPHIMRRFVDIGLLEPISQGDVPLFGSSTIIRARKALRLRRDFRLNLDAVALVMELLDRIEELERR